VQFWLYTVAYKYVGQGITEGDWKVIGQMVFSRNFLDSEIVENRHTCKHNKLILDFVYEIRKVIKVCQIKQALFCIMSV
jgi:hypothetical protein